MREFSLPWKLRKMSLGPRLLCGRRLNAGKVSLDVPLENKDRHEDGRWLLDVNPDYASSTLLDSGCGYKSVSRTDQHNRLRRGTRTDNFFLPPRSLCIISSIYRLVIFSFFLFKLSISTEMGAFRVFRFSRMLRLQLDHCCRSAVWQYVSCRWSVVPLCIK